LKMFSNLLQEYLFNKKQQIHVTAKNYMFQLQPIFIFHPK